MKILFNKIGGTRIESDQGIIEGNNMLMYYIASFLSREGTEGHEELTKDERIITFKHPTDTEKKICTFPKCNFSSLDGNLDLKHIYCICGKIVHLNISTPVYRGGMCDDCQTCVFDYRNKTVYFKPGEKPFILKDDTPINKLTNVFDEFESENE